MTQNNSQQFQAQFSLNGQQVKDELARIKQEIEGIDTAMKNLYNDGSEGYKNQMRQYADRRKALQQEQREMNSMGKVLKDLMKDLDKASPNQLKQTMRDINKAIDQGAIKRGTRDWQEAMRVLAKCDQELKKINAEIKAAGEGPKTGFFANLFNGSLVSNLMKFTGVAGVATTAISTLKSVLADVYSLNKDFEKQTAELAAVLGTTRDRIPSLIEQAKQLGETTMYTASEVAGLQINLAKLGFGTEEIKNSTGAILDFATATGAALPEAARVAGAALRAFGADSKEMERYVSTMAVATTKSALDFEKLRTSVGIAFPAAKAFGFTIEETTALLAKLSDSGYEASTAATALRNIFIQMSSENSKFVQDMGGPVESLDDFVRGLKLLQAEEANMGELTADVGKRAAAPLQVLIDAAPGIRDLTDELTDCGEAMRAMVAERMNTLWGSTMILKSAWQGLLLNIDEGNTIIREFNELLIDTISGITKIWKLIKPFVDGIGWEIVRIIDYIKIGIKDLLTGVGTLTRVIKDIFTFNFSDIFDALGEGFVEFGNNLKDGLKEIAMDWAKFHKGAMEEFKTEQKEVLALTEEERQELLKLKDLQIDIAKASIADLEKYLKKLRLEQKVSMGDELQRINSEIVQVQSRISELKGKLKANKDQWAQARALEAETEISLLDQAAMSQEEYRDKVYEINLQKLRDLQKHYKDSKSELMKYQREEMILTTKHKQALAAEERKRAEQETKERLKQALKNIENRKKLNDAAAKNVASHMKKGGASDYEADTKLEGMLYLNTVAAIEAKMKLYAKDSEEYKRLEEEKLKAAEDYESKITEIEVKAQDQATALAERILRHNNPFEQYRQQLSALDRYHELGLLSEDEYQNARAKLIKEKNVRIAQLTLDIMSDMLGSIGNLISESANNEIAQTEKKYDAEIAAAEKAGRDTTRIEQAKENAISEIQKQAAAKQFKIDMLSASIDLAKSIMKTMAEYAWPWNMAMAAADSAAFGIQIAAMKKGYEAKVAGFYDGGYTGYGGDYHRTAGVVHEGEFVANHQAVNNPAIRPTLDLLDYAQKHNTISSLTQQDLAMAAAFRSGRGFYDGGYTSPNVTVNPNVTVQRDDNYGRLAALLDRLDKKGIDANVYVDDVNRAQMRKNQLLNNKSRFA